MRFRSPRPPSAPSPRSPSPAALPFFLAALALIAGLGLACGGGADRGSGTTAAETDAGSEAFVRAMNRGQAQLENKSADGAVAAYSEAVEAAPASSPERRAAALRNLARAHLLARDSEAALAALEEAAALEAEAGREDAATPYLTGISLARLSRFDDALPHLREAARLDPEAAPLRFQLAQALQAAGDLESAREQYEETVRLDPFHTSAHFKLASLARQAGDGDAYNRHQREMLRLRSILGEENRSAEALETSAYTVAERAPARSAPPAQASPPRFEEVSREAFGEKAEETRGKIRAAAVTSVDPAGRPTLAAVTADGGMLRLRPRGEGGEEGWMEVEDLDVAIPAEIATDPALRLLPGNFHDPAPEKGPFDPALHAATDLLVLSPAGSRLFRGVPGEDGTWTGAVDVTAQSGLGSSEGPAGLRGRAAAWVDYEVDGDLDLAVLSDTGSGAELALWQNDGDGTFREVTEEVGLEEVGLESDAAGEGGAVLAADLTGNLTPDLLLAGDAGSRVFENQRGGRFAPRPDPPGPWPAAAGALAQDLDQDGELDVMLFGGEETVWLRSVEGAVERRSLPIPAAEAAAFDTDGDGWPDLAALGPDGGLTLWRNLGRPGGEGGGESAEGGFQQATAGSGLEGVSVPGGRLLAVDVDADGDTDLLTVGEAGLTVFSNETEGGRQLKVRLVGTKTNPNAFDARIEVRRGTSWRRHRVDGVPVEIGLGSGAAGNEAGNENGGEIDAVRVVWPNGIVDNEIGVAADTGILTLTEKNVAAGSCPFLYAWDGEGFRFVTDLLGNSPLGLSLARGVPLPADPDELVEIGGPESLVPRNGFYELEITEEMREVLYLDEARLVAVDHAPEVEPHPTDRLGPEPFPPSEIRALADLRSPLRAVGSDGVDRTAALAGLDGRFAAPGPLLPPPLRGATRPLELTLDFGSAALGRDDLVLALTGWLQYGDASTNIALSQGAAEVIPPRLEAVTAAGARVPVDRAVGLPAGKTKTILVDLAGALPPDARQLVLTTTFEVRWDRIALGTRLPKSALALHQAPPASAELAFRGFSEIRSRAPGHPTTPDYAAVSELPPWETAVSGWATRYGDVLPLVTERDDALALVAAGDGLRLRFAAEAFPPPAPGRARTFFFYSVGWDKDGDANVIDGETITPLPVALGAPRGEDGETDWDLTYNTRWVPKDAFRRQR